MVSVGVIKGSFLQFTKYAWLQIFKFLSNNVPAAQSIGKALRPWHMKNFEQSSGWEAKTVQPFFDSVHNTPGLLCHSCFMATKMKRKQFIRDDSRFDFM